MAAWLTEAWVKAVASSVAEAPAAPGANGVVELLISGGPDGDVRCHWSYEDGVPVGGQVGRAAAPDLSLSLVAADAEALVRGEVEPSVAFMRGRLKASGDGGLLLAVLASTTSPVFEAWRRALAARGAPGGG